MFKLIDQLFDRVAQRLADNLCENMSVVEQKRTAREAELPVETRVPVTVAAITTSVFTA